MREMTRAEYPHRELTDSIIAAAIAVHRELGPGYLEAVYENALEVELQVRGHQVRRQVAFCIHYRGRKIGEHRLDMLVDDTVVVELKSVEALHRTHVAQLRSTLKATGRIVGLLLNFNQATLKDGITRVVQSCK